MTTSLVRETVSRRVGGQARVPQRRVRFPPARNGEGELRGEIVRARSLGGGLPSAAASPASPVRRARGPMSWRSACTALPVQCGARTRCAMQSWQPETAWGFHPPVLMIHDCAPERRTGLPNDRLHVGPGGGDHGPRRRSCDAGHLHAAAPPRSAFSIWVSIIWRRVSGTWTSALRRRAAIRHTPVLHDTEVPACQVLQVPGHAQRGCLGVGRWDHFGEPVPCRSQSRAVAVRYFATSALAMARRDLGQALHQQVWCKAFSGCIGRHAASSGLWRAPSASRAPPGAPARTEHRR